MAFINQSAYYANYGLHNGGGGAMGSGMLEAVEDKIRELVPVLKMTDVPISYQPCTVSFNMAASDVNMTLAKEDYEARPISLSAFINSDSTSNRYGLIEMDLEIMTLLSFSGPGISLLQYTLTSHLSLTIAKTYGDLSDADTYKYSINGMRQSYNCQLRACVRDDGEVDPPFNLHVDGINWQVTENEDRLFITMTYPRNADYLWDLNRYTSADNIREVRSSLMYQTGLWYHMFTVDDDVMHLAESQYALEVQHETCNGTIKYIDYRRNV